MGIFTSTTAAAEKISRLGHSASSPEGAALTLPVPIPIRAPWHGDAGIELVASRIAPGRLAALAHRTREVSTIVPAGRLDDLREVTPALAPGGLGDEILSRVLVHDDLVDHVADMRLVLRSIDHGAEVRTAPQVPCWMMILGRSVVVLPVDGADSALGLVLLHGAPYVTPALWMFDQAWRSAVPLQAGASRATRLTVWQIRVLEHLARGQKDEVAARELGVSTRTYRRHVTHLCDALQASSRFEAGVCAAQAGLI